MVGYNRDLFLTHDSCSSRGTWRLRSPCLLMEQPPAHPSRWQRGTALWRTSRWSGKCSGPEVRPHHFSLEEPEREELEIFGQQHNDFRTGVSGMAGSRSSRGVTRNLSPLPALLSWGLASSQVNCSFLVPPTLPRGPRLCLVRPIVQRFQQKEHTELLGSCACP